LQHHHRGHDPRRHAAPTDLGEQVSEQLVGKQPVTLAVQHRPDRLLADAASHSAAVPRHRSPCLGVTPAVIRRSRTKNHINVILPDPAATSEHARSRKTPVI
jgi:hypothetical protein